MHRLRLALALALLVGSVCAVGAGPAAGAVTTTCVDLGTPSAVRCPAGSTGIHHSIAEALSVTSAGGRIQIEPGTYAEDVVVHPANVTLFGDPTQARPVIVGRSGSDEPAVYVWPEAANATLRHLDIRAGLPLIVSGPAVPGPGPHVTVADVALTGTSGCADIGGPVTATDVVARSTFGQCLFVDTYAAGSTFTRVSATVSGRAGAGGTTARGARPRLSLVRSVALTALAPVSIDASTLAAPQGTGLQADSGAVHVRRTTVAAGASAIALNGGTLTVEDSVVVAADDGAVAVGAGPTTRATLRNVTVFAPGRQALGVRASPASGLSTPGAAVSVVNSIVRTGGTDLVAGGGSSTCYRTGSGSPPTLLPAACAGGTLTASHTNYRAGTSVQDGGGNQYADPLFARPVPDGGLNLRVRRGSPTIDAGAPVPAGDTDRLGAPRPAPGTRPDLGAYETPLATTALAIVEATARQGRITLKLRLPSAGHIAVASTVRSHGRSVRYAAIARAVAAGRTTVAFAPGNRAAAILRRLAHTRRTTVGVTLTFTPTGGAAATRTRSVAVRGLRKH